MMIKIQKKLFIICLCALFSVAFHAYLSMRGQSLFKGDRFASSICRVSSAFNCDNTLVSEYAHFAGLPLSDWGLSLNIVIAFLAFVLFAGLAENVFTIGVMLALLVSVSVGASLVLLGLSYFVLDMFCPFCIILYILSFVMGVVYYKVGRVIFTKRAFSLSQLSKSWGQLNGAMMVGVLIAWVGMAFLSDKVFAQVSGNNISQKKTPYLLLDWQSAPVKEITQAPLLTKGAKKGEAVITITEFADFLCPHCKDSYYLLKMFQKSHPDVRLNFFSFSLDRCEVKGGISCFLTRVVWCAKKQDKAWQVHDFIFENQKLFMQSQSTKLALQTLKNNLKLGFNWQQLEKCVAGNFSLEMAKKQIEAGLQIYITGTPSILVNAKKINPQYLIQTIKAIRKTLL